MSRLLVVLLCVMAADTWAATVGRLVPLRGSISDVAVDDRRQLVYAANFTANRVEVFSSVDFSPRPSLVVAETPYTLGLSRSGRFLIVGHFLGGMTIFDFDGNQRRNLTYPELVLAVAFGVDETAYIATTKGFYRLDPLTGLRTPISLTFNPKTCDIPVNPGVKGIDIVMASAGVSGDGQTLFFFADIEGSAPPECAPPDPNGFYLMRYRPAEGDLFVESWTVSPPGGPRVVSVNEDGTKVMAGWSLFWLDPRQTYVRAQVPNVLGRFALGGHAYDWKRNRIYVQIPVLENNATSAPPVLHVMDPHNLAVQEILQLPNPVAGRMVFSPDLNRIFAVSESGVLVLDLEQTGKAPRVAADKEDLLFLSNACERITMRQTLRIEDPTGQRPDFRITPAGGDGAVRVYPSTGRAPMEVTVEVDPVRFQSQQGTVSVNLNITSKEAVNVPMPVRVLVNTRHFDQRGKIINFPGRNVDVVADPARMRFYLLRQDRNEVIVVDGNSLEPVARFKTGNTPVQMAVTRDARYLLTTADNSQYIAVHDLFTLQELDPILMPVGYYARSIAATNARIWATTRTVTDKFKCDGPVPGTHQVLAVDVLHRYAAPPPRLGIYVNCVDEGSLVTASPTGETALLAMPTGHTLLYEAAANTWVAGRHDFDSLGGTAAALADHLYLAETSLLDMALFPALKFDGQLKAAGAATLRDGMFLRTYTSAPGPGYIEKFVFEGSFDSRSVRLIEAPLTPYTPPEPMNLIGATVLPLLRTLAVLVWPKQIISLSTSGIIAIDEDFDAPTPIPSIETVFNAADQTPALAPGSLVVIRGSGLATTAASSPGLPYPTALDQACVQLNGMALPLVRVSPGEIIAQIPYDAAPGGSLVVKSYGGISSSFSLPMSIAAPAIFRNGSAGPLTGLATIVRAENGQLVTFSNPIRPEDRISIYLTGMGPVNPLVPAGYPSPADPPARVILEPQVTLGGTALPVTFAGLEPGQAGVYRIDASVPWWVKTGNSMPLVIRQGPSETAVEVRVVPK